MTKSPATNKKKASGNASKNKNTASSFFKYIFTNRTLQPNFIFSVAVTTIKLLFIFVLIIAVSGTGIVMGVAKAYYETIPELELDTIASQKLSSFIYDRNGALITTYRGSENRIWESIANMPENLKNAFIAVEDARFYTHDGVDLKRIAGAFVNNMRNDSVQGGSTITQQLVKLRVLSTEQTYKRKIQEAYIAMEIEKTQSKDQILEWYLNTILLGESNYGVVAAAKDYFGKDTSQLTLRECATLAGITRNPTRYNPRRCLYTTKMPEVSVNRTNYVLETMYHNNFITYDQYQEALGDTPAIKREYDAGTITELAYRARLSNGMQIIESSQINTLYKMPAAVESVLFDVETQLLIKNDMQINNANRKIVRNQIQSGGYKIYSTIDPKIQAIAEDVVYNWTSYPKMGNPSDAVYSVTDQTTGIRTQTIQPQAAVSIFDYTTGEIVAVIGGRTPPTQFLEYNRARSSTMPVGSSIKPLAVYGPALDLGASPSSITNNMPVAIPGWTTGKGYPANSTRGDFKGLLTLRTAMRNSLNTASANTLLDYVGINDSKNYLISLGIDPDHINPDGFGLSLGSSGITPIEMSVAFGTIANKGTYQMPLTFTKVVDSHGNTVLDMKATQKENTRQVFRPGTSWMLVDMLVDAASRGTGTASKISGITVGGKTGTNSDYKGVSFSGITPYYACSVWVGSDNNKALYSGATGNKEAAPLWQAIMARVHTELALENRPIISDSPDSLGLVQLETCSLSGQLVTDACRVDPNFVPVTDWHHKDSVPTLSCTMHVEAPICVDSGSLATTYCPNTVAHAAILLPEGSRAELLTPEQRSTLLPNSILHVPTDTTLEMLRADPAFASYFCPLHSAYTSPPTDDLGNNLAGGDPDSVG